MQRRAAVFSRVINSQPALLHQIIDHRTCPFTLGCTVQTCKVVLICEFDVSAVGLQQFHQFEITVVGSEEDGAEGLLVLRQEIYPG
jgi:hypothetical protein